MIRAFSIFLASIILSSAIWGQPGPEGILSVNVVDVSGTRIRDARVLEAYVRPGKVVTEGYNIFDNPPSRYRPRDAERSSFAARIVCGEKHSIAVSAAGYKYVLKVDIARDCPAEVTVVLERSSGPLPQITTVLTTLTGRVRGQNGIPLDGFLRIIQGTKSYIPKIGADGSFTARLLPGVYQISLEHGRCNTYQINNYRIGPQPKTIELDADCE